MWCGWHRTAYAVCIQQMLSKMALRWCRGGELLNKVVVFVFFAQKKYSCRFIKFRLNHWWQMDYSDDVVHTFLGLDSGIYLVVNGRVTSLLVFIQNILNCVPKTNEAFTGLERHGGKWLIKKKIILGWSNPLTRRTATAKVCLQRTQQSDC